jgi:mono/diheme cytochrome c family protein
MQKGMALMGGHRRTAPLAILLAAGFTACVSGPVVQPRLSPPSPEPVSLSDDERRESQVLLGKSLFVERCGKCHDERGDKPLPSGPPLNQRELTTEQIARAVRSRFRDKTDAERAAVVAYIQSFLVKSSPERSESKQPRETS